MLKIIRGFKLSERTYHFILNMVFGFEFAYLLITFSVPELPGYKMFAKIEHISVLIKNEKGQKIDFFSYMPTVYYQIDKTLAMKMARFICQKRSDSALYLILKNNERYEFKKPNCNSKELQ